MTPSIKDRADQYLDGLITHEEFALYLADAIAHDPDTASIVAKAIIHEEERLASITSATISYRD